MGGRLGRRRRAHLAGWDDRRICPALPSSQDDVPEDHQEARRVPPRVRDRGVLPTVLLRVRGCDGVVVQARRLHHQGAEAVRHQPARQERAAVQLCVSDLGLLRVHAAQGDRRAGDARAPLTRRAPVLLGHHHALHALLRRLFHGRRRGVLRAAGRSGHLQVLPGGDQAVPVARPRVQALLWDTVPDREGHPMGLDGHHGVEGRPRYPQGG